MAGMLVADLYFAAVGGRWCRGPGGAHPAEPCATDVVPGTLCGFLHCQGCSPVPRDLGNHGELRHRLSPGPAVLDSRCDRRRHRRLFAMAIFRLRLPFGLRHREEIYSLANIGPNASLYARWLLETHGPWLLAAPLVLFGRVLPVRPDNRREIRWLLGFAALVIAAYLIYAVFETWTYLRFLLPAMAIAIIAVARHRQCRPQPLAGRGSRGGSRAGRARARLRSTSPRRDNTAYFVLRISTFAPAPSVNG